VRYLSLSELKGPLQLQSRPDPRPGEGEAVVELRCAALNRRDYWITQGLYPGIRLPAVLGSDGAGVVAATGQGVDAAWLGREVVINPGWEWGGNPRAQGASFRILGMPDDGTFATHVVVPAIYLHSRPAHLDWRQAAALPLGGVTAYRALFTQGRLQAGETVLVTGIGGGVATFALQLAVAAGATVAVTSSSQEKLERARQLGAAAGFDYTADDWAKTLHEQIGHVDLVIDGAAGEGHARLIELAVPGGRIVNYGATAGPPQKLDLFKVFWKQLHLIGSTMGSPDDFAAMLQFVERHQIVPTLDQQFPLADGNAALERMRDAQHFGKIVLVVDAGR